MADFVDASNSFRVLCSELDNTGLKWAVWKGLSEIDRGLSGAGDLDILFAARDEPQVRQLLSSLGWFQADWKKKPVSQIAHFFSYNGHRGFFHLHAYFGITTGESGLKEYRFPLENLILDSRVLDPSVGLWTAQSDVLRQLFQLRRLLKAGSLLSRAIYRRELTQYRREWEVLSAEKMVVRSPISSPFLESRRHNLWTRTLPWLR